MKDLERIIRECIKGKKKAQEKFYDHFAPLVMGIACRYTNKELQADDIFQESFIKIFSKLEKLEKNKSVSMWIRKITVNTALDQLKLRKGIWMAPLDKIEVDDNRYSDILDHLTNEQIVNCINELSDGYKTIFNMYVIDGFSHKEISEQLQISESTSRSQLTYARRLLQEKLKKLGIGRYESVI